ncbi:ABC transporter permease subunit [Pseudokineococcus marinus]|uniref:ABC transporter permease subunit n=1 Tax=Pseudokineococcus marinus TaxID=351215 RepID=A0A849BNN3_9ACTN|nr:ABC transporter permease subunit [Pseudokineococcus marinus]NNH23025.1 ABC transporter permease subunit [Pseudokineococcus marinus]
MSAVVDHLLDPESWSGPGGLVNRLVEHVGISALALLLAVVVAVPVGLWLGHLGRGGFVALNIGGFGRAVPTFALLVVFVLLPAPFGANLQSFVLALALFTVPPLLTNTWTGVREADRAAVDAGRGLGMSGWQLLRRVELPLATPLMMSGLRLAAVQVVATTTVIGLVGGGSLGRIINQGFVSQDQAQVVVGAVLVALLALATELGLGVVERRAARRSSGRTRSQEPEEVDDEQGRRPDEAGAGTSARGAAQASR